MMKRSALIIILLSLFIINSTQAASPFEVCDNSIYTFQWSY